MTAREIGRRSDALHASNNSRRMLCDRLARVEEVARELYACGNSACATCQYRRKTKPCELFYKLRELGLVP